MKLIDYISSEQNRLVYPQMGNIGLKLTGYKLYEVYNSPKKQLEVAKAMDETFGGDFVYPMDYGIIFVETLGLSLLKPEYDFPSTLENPVKNREVLSKMKVPDPYNDGNMPVYLESLKLIADSFDKPLTAALVGPFTLAVELAGATDVARGIIKNPDFIKELLEYTTEVVSVFAKAAVKAGVKFLQISEPSGVILSPKRFENLVAANLRKVFHGLDTYKILHICGETTFLIEELLNCGADGLSLDQIVNLKDFAAKVPKDTVIIGNIDPIDVLGEKSSKEVEEETVKLLRDMKDYPNFMLAPGCDCIPETPFDNLKAFVKAGHTKSGDL